MTIVSNPVEVMRQYITLLVKNFEVKTHIAYLLAI